MLWVLVVLWVVFMEVLLWVRDLVEVWLIGLGKWLVCWMFMGVLGYVEWDDGKVLDLGVDLGVGGELLG